MKNAASILFFLNLLFAVQGIAQDNVKYFSIHPSKEKIPNSLYSAIDFIDLRKDTTQLGMVQIGLMNQRVWLIPKDPIQVQLSALLSSFIDSSAQKGKLLLALRRCTFTEKTKASSETGFFYIRADLFAEDNGYRWLDNLDTIIHFKAMDVTQRLLRTGESAIVNFVQRNLTRRPSAENFYSRYEVVNMDSLQKASLNIYTLHEYKEGIYRNYDEFKQQIPSIVQYSVLEKKGKLNKVMVTGDDLKEKAMDEDEMYAVVYKGMPFIPTKNGFHALYKKENDFYYTGITKTFNQGAAMMFGLLGVLIAGSNVEISDYKMDHVNGAFLYAGKAKNSGPE